jgi:hypothetical protein
MDGCHGNRSFTDRTGNPFGGAAANVTGGEDAWSTGLKGVRLTLQRPVPRGYIPAGQDEPALIKAEEWGQPFRMNTAAAGTSSCRPCPS